MTVPHPLILNSDRQDPMDRLSRRVDLVPSVISPARYASRYSGRRHASVASFDDLRGVLAAAMQLAHTAPFTCVIAATEKSVAAAAYLRTIFGIPGLRLDGAFAFTHKGEMKRALRAGRIPVAHSLTVPGFDELLGASDSLGWPVVVKPSLGSGGKGTFVVEDRAELVALVEASAAESNPLEVPLHVEQWLEVEAEYHCDAVVRDGAVIMDSVSRMFAPLISVDRASRAGSYRVSQDSPLSREIRRLSREIVEVLGLHDGVTHLECLVTSAGVYAGEIACRPGGGAVTDVVHRATGVDLWEELIAAELGAPASVGAMPSRSGPVWGWTYFRADHEDPARVARLPGVREVRVERAAGIAVLEADDEQQMLDLHAEVVGQRT